MSVRAGVLDLSIEPPEVVCVDTSALIRALFDDQPQHADYLGFFARVAEAGSTIVYSELLDLELAQMCVKSARSRSNGRREEPTRLGGGGFEPRPTDDPPPSLAPHQGAGGRTRPRSSQTGRSVVESCRQRTAT